MLRITTLGLTLVLAACAETKVESKRFLEGSSEPDRDREPALYFTVEVPDLGASKAPVAARALDRDCRDAGALKGCLAEALQSGGASVQAAEVSDELARRLLALADTDGPAVFPFVAADAVIGAGLLDAYDTNRLEVAEMLTHLVQRDRHYTDGSMIGFRSEELYQAPQAYVSVRAVLKRKGEVGRAIVQSDDAGHHEVHATGPVQVVLAEVECSRDRIPMTYDFTVEVKGPDGAVVQTLERLGWSSPYCPEDGAAAFPEELTLSPKVGG